jgi:hypothetical protein
VGTFNLYNSASKGIAREALLAIISVWKITSTAYLLLFHKLVIPIIEGLGERRSRHFASKMVYIPHTVNAMLEMIHV